MIEFGDIINHKVAVYLNSHYASPPSRAILLYNTSDVTKLQKLSDHKLI